MKFYLNHESTRKNFHSIWKSFNKFYLQLDEKPSEWEDRITLYVGYLINNKCKSCTIKSYICALKAVLRSVGINLKTNSYLLGSLVKACQYQNDRVRMRLPIHKFMVNMLIEEAIKVYTEKNQPYLAILYALIFSTAYYGLLHIGKIAAGSHPILATDVQIGTNKKKFMLILRTLKTHWKNKKMQIIRIKAINNPSNQKQKCQITHYCPFELLQQFLCCCGTCRHPKEPFFVFSDNSQIQPQQLRTVLHHLLNNLSFNDRAYSFNGFHIGRASNLLEMGVSIETIKKLGHWKSNTVYSYLR